MILYRVSYYTLHDIGGWQRAVVHRGSKSAADQFATEVVQQNREWITDESCFENDCVSAEEALNPTITRIKITRKSQMLDELELVNITNAR